MGDIRRKLGIDVDVDARRGVSAFDDLADAARSMATDVERSTEQAERSTRDFAESADNLASSSAQLAGGLGDLGGALGMLPGPLGSLGAGMESAAPIIMGVTGAADLASLAMNSNALATARARAATIAKTVSEKAALVATKAATAGQWLLNAAMSANPIGLVVLAVAGLVAGFVVLYKRSATVRRIVDAVWSSVKTAGRWIGDLAVKVGKFLLKWSPLGIAVRIVRDNFGQVAGKVRDLGVWIGTRVVGSFATFREKAGAVGTWMRDKLGGMVRAVVTPFEALYDAIRDVIDWLGKIKIPKGLTDIASGIGGVLGLGSAPVTVGSTPVTGGGSSYAPRRSMATAAFGLPDLSALFSRTVVATPGTPVIHVDARTFVQVDGALDPAAVGDQILEILRRLERRRPGSIAALLGRWISGAR